MARRRPREKVRVQKYNRGSYLRNKLLWHYSGVYRIPHEDMELIRHFAQKSNDSINETILKYITWGLEVEKDEEMAQKNVNRSINSRQTHAHRPSLS